MFVSHVSLVVCQAGTQIKGDISKVSLVYILVKIHGHASCFLSSHLHPLSVARGEDEVIGEQARQLDLPLYWSTILWNMPKNDARLPIRLTQESHFPLHVITQTYFSAP